MTVVKWSPHAFLWEGWLAALRIMALCTVPKSGQKRLWLTLQEDPRCWHIVCSCGPHSFPSELSQALPLCLGTCPLFPPHLSILLSLSVDTHLVWGMERMVFERAEELRILSFVTLFMPLFSFTTSKAQTSEFKSQEETLYLNVFNGQLSSLSEGFGMSVSCMRSGGREEPKWEGKPMGRSREEAVVNISQTSPCWR